MTSNRNCPLCGAGNDRPLFVAAGHTIARCGGCGLIRTLETPPESALESLYSDNYYSGSKDSQGYYSYEKERPALEKGFRKRLALLSRYSRGGRLLDVGCALGFLLSAAKEMGWEPYGVDRAAFGIEWAKKNLGLENLHAGELETAGFGNNFFDAVTMVDVLEHVTDPVKAIGEIHAALKPGGVFLLDTWDSGSLTARLLGKHWPIIAPPDHLFYFNRKTIRLLFEKANFKILEMRKMGRHMTPGSLATKLPNGIPLRDALLDRAGKLRLAIPINLYDNMIVIARKEG